MKLLVTCSLSSDVTDISKLREAFPKRKRHSSSINKHQLFLLNNSWVFNYFEDDSDTAEPLTGETQNIFELAGVIKADSK